MLTRTAALLRAHPGAYLHVTAPDEESVQAAVVGFFSPSIAVDDGWIPVKKYIEQDLGVNTEREQAYWEDWDEPALRRIIQQQRKITETSKKLEMKKPCGHAAIA